MKTLTTINHIYKKNKDKTLDDMYMTLADNMSKLSTCARVQVGAILIADDRPLLSGYNGSPKGHEHCIDIYKRKYDEYMANSKEPIGIFTFEDFMRLPEVREEHGKFSRLHEIHAEINIVAQAANKGLSTKNARLYITHSPCNDCCKSILTAGIKEIVFRNLYDRETEGLQILIQSGISVRQLTNEGESLEYKLEG